VAAKALRQSLDGGPCLALFYDLDHPAQRFVRIAGDTFLHPHFSDERREAVKPLPAMAVRRRFNQRSALHDPSPEDLPARPV
jgi:hypothetical protein